MKINDWQIIEYDEVKSTNDEALIMSQKSLAGYYVIKADKQTGGRGRRGRSWVGLEGNLFFSMLFEFDIKKFGILTVICSLTLLQCIEKLNDKVKVQIKWPNDVLLNGAKVSGILLEKAEGDFVVAGIGVNIMQSPKSEQMMYPVTSLKENYINTTANDFLKLYLEIFDNNVKKLKENGFTGLRQQWVDKAKGIGERIVVKQNNKEISGILEGIDDDACLLLKENNNISRVLAGDVYYES